MKAPEYICEDRARDTMGYIVMLMYKNGSVADHKWTTSNFKDLKTVIKQTVAALASAFIRTGFVHGDLHGGNILMRKTKKTELKYEDMSLPTNGMYAIIMDFQRSSFSYDITEFKKSLRKLFGCLRTPRESSKISIDNVGLVRSLSALESLDKTTITKLLTAVDVMRIEYTRR